MLWKNPRFCRDCKLSHLKMTSKSCTDKVRKRYLHLKKSHVLAWYKILHRYVIHLYFYKLKAVYKIKQNQKFCYNWTLHFSSMLTWREPLSQLSQRVLALTKRFAYTLWFALHALLFAGRPWNFQRLFIMNGRHFSAQKIKTSFTYAIQKTLKVSR